MNWKAKKVDIETTNRLLDILTNDMNELEEAAYRIVQTDVDRAIIAILESLPFI